MTNWWVFLLGWPVLLVALSLSGFGTFRNRPWYLYTAAILILPVVLFFSWLAMIVLQEPGSHI